MYVLIIVRNTQVIEDLKIEVYFLEKFSSLMCDVRSTFFYRSYQTFKDTHLSSITLFSIIEGT